VIAAESVPWLPIISTASGAVLTLLGVASWKYATRKLIAEAENLEAQTAERVVALARSQMETDRGHFVDCEARLTAAEVRIARQYAEMAEQRAAWTAEVAALHHELHIQREAYARMMAAWATAWEAGRSVPPPLLELGPWEPPDSPAQPGGG